MLRYRLQQPRLPLISLFLGLCCLGAVWATGERGLPAEEGIQNFGKVSDGLFRGAQPGTAGISNLVRLGVKAIINLRMPDESWKDEEIQARAHGILYTNLPMHRLGKPADDQVRKVLSLIETLPGPVFVHCQHGCDRTGTIIACYRMKHDHWSYNDALREAERYGLSAFERGMRDYINQFAKARSRPPKS